MHYSRKSNSTADVLLCLYIKQKVLVMEAKFDKIDWNKVPKQKKNPQPTGDTKKNIELENNDKLEHTEEVNDMVTSTIVETQSDINANAAVAAADEMASAPRIKEASAPKASHAKRRGRDLSSGMDMMEMDFMLDVVEETAGDLETEISMRQLCFNEILRRESLHEIGSSALKVYATNGPVYGKDIQCQAMKELSIRTTQNCK